MTFLRIDDRRHWYGLPYGGWLYLAVFDDRCKIGITDQLGPRLSCVPAEGGYRIDDIRHVYAARFEQFNENRRREKLIKECFGTKRPGPRRRHTEWFKRAAEPFAVLFMRNPDAADAYLLIRRGLGLDKRAPTFKPYPRPVVEEAA